MKKAKVNKDEQSPIGINLKGIQAIFIAKTRGDVYRYAHARDLFLAVENLFVMILREKIKYGDEGHLKKQFKDVKSVFEYVRDEFQGILDEFGIDLDIAGQE